MILVEETLQNLKEFSCTYKKALFVDRENFHQVKYPEDCSEQCWPVEQIVSLNSSFLSSLNRKGNVYAILTREPNGGEWNPKYVGQSKSTFLRNRIHKHLIKGSKNTGSKFNKVQEAVFRGQEIAVTFVMVCPEGLRHFVEETIIVAEKTRLTWNDRNPGQQ